MVHRPKQRSVKEVITICLLLLAIVWLCFLLYGIYQKEERARQTVGETRAELAALDARKNDLSNTVTDMSSERGQEASLRETFGVARPGEDVIIVVPKKDIAPPPAPTLWQKVKAFFSF